MKNLFCKRLASWVYMKRPLSSSTERSASYRKRESVSIIGNGSYNRNIDQIPTYAEITGNTSTDKLLTEIRDLLKTRVRGEEEQRYEADKEDEMKNDWMLAVAVLDRICAIAVTVFYVVGTVVLFVLFVKHPYPEIVTSSFSPSSSSATDIPLISGDPPPSRMRVPSRDAS